MLYNRRKYQGGYIQTLVETLVKKLDHMSPERLAEVDDFIDFIIQRDRDTQLYKDFDQASESVFEKVWDNDDDAVYDSL